MRRPSREWLKFAATRFCGLAVDFVFLLVAYFASILLRFDLQPPRWGWRTMLMAFVSVGVVHLTMLAVFGAYRLSWRRTRLDDLPRYFLASFASCIVLTALRFVLPVESYAHVRPPYSVTLICFVLASLALVGWRIVWSWLWDEYLKDDRLIERKARHMDDSPVRKYFSGKTVMITGAGGSIGSELVRQVADLSPKCVLLVERGENALYEIDREMRGLDAPVPTVSLMKDINDVAAMEAIFEEYRPEVVLHAAAYKHVPMVEANPEEGWRNNAEGTEKVAKLALKYRARRFVLISTDKAVNPVSVMGKTKLAAEKAIMALNERSEVKGQRSEVKGQRSEVKGQRSKGEGQRSDEGELRRLTSDLGPSTSFAAVRFGNVLGSSGSVVPLFREQIAKRRPITVTHPDMRRYFMTVEEAVGLVLQAASRPEQAIYTLDMGEPMRIVDLAEQMIRQAGYRPYVDIPIVFTGIRPGEKLFEELDVSEKSGHYKTDMAKIYITKVVGG